MHLQLNTRLIQVTLTRAPGYLHFLITGAYDFEDFRVLVLGCRDECVKAGMTRALLDIRSVAGDIPGLERYNLGVLFAETWGGRLKAGILSPRDRINKLFENTAVNRYAQVLVHAEEEAILECC